MCLFSIIKLLFSTRKWYRTLSFPKTAGRAKGLLGNDASLSILRAAFYNFSVVPLDISYPEEPKLFFLIYFSYPDISLIRSPDKMFSRVSFGMRW